MSVAILFDTLRFYYWFLLKKTTQKEYPKKLNKQKTDKEKSAFPMEQTKKRTPQTHAMLC